MILLVLGFVAVVLIVFTAVLLATRPSAEQSAVEKRVLESVVSQTGREPARSLLPAHLEVLEAGPFPWLDALLAETWMSRWLQVLIVQGQAGITVGTLAVSTVALLCGVFAGAYWFSSLLPFSAGVAVLTAYVPVLYLKFKRSRRVAAFNAALPDCIEMCARSLRVGNSIVAAIDIVATEAVEPAKTEFSEVFKKQNYGLPLRDALLQMLDRVPSMDLQVFVTGILVQKDTGGNLAEVLDRIVFVIRERLRIHREIRTHTAQGRMTGWILCLLPPAMLVIINIANPGYSDVLFHEPMGRHMLYGGAGLLMFGAFLIRKIVNGIEV